MGKNLSDVIRRRAQIMAYRRAIDLVKDRLSEHLRAFTGNPEGFYRVSRLSHLIVDDLNAEVNELLMGLDDNVLVCNNTDAANMKKSLGAKIVYDRSGEQSDD